MLSILSGLSPADHLGHLRTESSRFRAVLADADPDVRVPHCPDWSAADLLWHLAEVQGFWAHVVTTRPTAPHDEARTPRPDAYADLLTAFDANHAALVAALEAADPAEEAWTWSSEQTVGFTFRRQAHEALVHRVDAEQAVGAAPAPIDAALAADGVVETLDVMFGGTPPWGAFTPSDRYVRVDLTDAGSVWVQLGRFTGTDPEGTVRDEDDISVVPDPGVEPAVTVTGSAEAVDLWLWHRGDDAAISVDGDRAVYDLFRSCVDHPLD